MTKDTSKQALSSHVLMNVSDGDELRVAVIKDGRLQTLIHERMSEQQSLGNIYKGRVSNVEPSLDAAFIDLGGEKNGFLHVDDVQHSEGPGARIEKVLKRGDEVLVQITKEGIRDKGPCVTMGISLPGRNLVLAADVSGRGSMKGVSRKIVDERERRRLKRLLDGFEAPEGFGYIVRTAGADRLDEEIILDQQYLMRLWKEIDGKSQRVKAPACVYKESDVVLRTLRDAVTAETQSVIIDKEALFDEARAFAQIFMPELAGRIQLHCEELPLFAYYNVDERLAVAYDRQVEMPSGGNIVIEQTEALISIDINSARSRSGGDVEATALNTNLEAVHVIAEQLILRDLGGLVIIDFIDMESREHQRLVQLALRKALLDDKAKTHVAPISRFGLVEMTRQRTRPSHRVSSSTECQVCVGTGRVKTAETLTIECMRAIRAEVVGKAVTRVEVLLPPDIGLSIMNNRSREIAHIESAHDCQVVFLGDSLMKSRSFRVSSVAKKRRRDGKREEKREEPVRPALIAPLLEEQARIAAQAREIEEKGARVVEKELMAAMYPNEYPTVAVDETPAPQGESKEPSAAAVATIGPVQRATPTVWEEAASLRSLLFSTPKAYVLSADESSQVTGAQEGLALSAKAATTPRPAHGGRRRSRRR